MTDTIYKAAIAAYFDAAVKGYMRADIPQELHNRPHDVWERNQELDKQLQETWMQLDSDEQAIEEFCGE